jgi:hypothetical protein
VWEWAKLIIEEIARESEKKIATLFSRDREDSEREKEQHQVIEWWKRISKFIQLTGSSQ